MSKSAMVAVGDVASGGSTWQPWPSTWMWPTATYVYGDPYAPDYANEVEVERGDYDAVLRFYRRCDRSRTMVKEITIPLGVLDWLAAKES